MNAVTPVTNLDTALSLARAGAFVFPCQSSGPNRKQPCKGVYWRSVSTRDERDIRRLWAQYPDAVPGIDLAKSGLLVIDCDRKLNDGLAWLQAYAGRHDDALDAVPQTDTPGGGRHHFYRNSFDPPHGNGRGQLPPKREADVDVRGHGGFVIGPGAAFADGGSYAGHGSIFDAPEPPGWLRDLLTRPQAVGSPPVAFTVAPEPVSDARLAAYGETALGELLADLASAPPGTRNDEANRIAFRVGQLVGAGCLTRSHAMAALEQSALSWGIRPNDKALGPRGTISRALAAGEKEPRGPVDTPPSVEILIGGEIVDPATGEVLPAPARPQQPGELPDHLTNIPGLVGDITDWITDTALYPQRGLALGAALTIVGTAAGRHLGGPTRSGTHLYIVGLAPSGAGKDHALGLISTILAAADMRAHIGPSQFISMPAVINFLVRSPLAVCAMDEFGAFLKRINNRRASGFEGAISGLLRSAWGSSFKAMTTPEWAGRACETIFSPALSIYGTSTAREFYDSLEGSDVTNGLLNRFLVIETRLRPKERPRLQDPEHVPAEIVAGLKAIYNRDPMAAAQLCQSRQPPPYVTIPITPDAEQIRRGLVEEINTRGDADPALEPFLARTAENALRLATIAAIGQRVRKPEIDAATMAWAREFAVWSTDRLAEGAGLYIADSDTQAAANAVRRAIGDGGGRIKRRDLLRALAHKYKSRELDEVIRSLAEAEQIRIEKLVPTEEGGRPSIFYSS